MTVTTIKSFSVELNEYEVNVIREALEAYAKVKRQEYKETRTDEASDKDSVTRTLRNQFGQMVNVHYMGLD